MQSENSEYKYMFQTYYLGSIFTEQKIQILKLL